MEPRVFNARTPVSFNRPARLDLDIVAHHIAHARDETRYRLIKAAAYRLAQQRNFEPGHELDDWLAAEHEVLTTVCDEL